MSFFIKVQFRSNCLDLENMRGLDFFSWVSLWEAFCCLRLEEARQTLSGLLHSGLVERLPLPRDSREVEMGAVASGEVSTDVMG